MAPATTHPPGVAGPTTRTCPTCGTDLGFRPGSGGSHGRSFAHCSGCGGSFTLYGGQVTPI